MNKNNQFHTLNENSSQDKLINYIPIDNNIKTNKKTLIERINSSLNNKKSNIKKYSVNPYKLNTDFSNRKLCKEDDHIFFNDYTENKILGKSLTFEEMGNKRGRKKRKSIFEINESNPLSLIESLKYLNKDTSLHGKNFEKIKICEIVLGILSLISIILALIDNEFYIKETRQFYNDLVINKNISKLEAVKKLDKRSITKTENFIRYLNGITSISICLFIIMKYEYYIIGDKLNKKISEYDGLNTTGYTKFIILECIICIIFYPPYLNKICYGKNIKTIFVYSFNSILLSFNILKAYNFFKLIIIQSKFNSKISKIICQSFKIETGNKFIIRSELNSNIYKHFSVILIFFWCLFSALTRDFEIFSFDINVYLDGKKGINDLQNFMNNFWLIKITILNVAFGDEYPRTNIGRFIAFLSSIIGILCIGILIASIYGNLQFNINERKAYLKLKKVFSSKNNQNKAANVIKTILLIAKNSKTKHLNNKSNHYREKIILILKIRAETKIFKNELLISRVYSIPMNDLIKTMETNLYEHLLDITNDLDKVNFIEREFTLIEKNQQFIGEKLKKITFIQDKISKILSDTHNINYLKHQNEKIIKQKEIKEKKLNIKQSKEMKVNVNVKKIFSFHNEEKKKKKENYKNNLIIRKHKNLESKLSKNLIGIGIRLNKIERSNSDKIKYKGKIGNITPLNRNKKKKGLYSKIRKNHYSTIIELNKKVSLTLNDFDTLLPNNNFMTTFHKSLNINNNP